MPPTSVHARDTAARLGNDVFANGEKRPRDVHVDEDERKPKREKTEESEDDDAGEEMEIDDDEDTGAKAKNGGKPHVVISQPRALISANMLLRRRHSSASYATVGAATVYKSSTRSHRRRPFSVVPTVRGHLSV